MKKLLLLLSVTGLIAGCATQKKSSKTPPSTAVRATPTGDTTKRLPPQKIGAPKAYSDVITSKAITKPGLFTVHKVDEKWYFEIPDSLLNREIMAITRYSKVPGGAALYGGSLLISRRLHGRKDLIITFFYG